MLAPARPFQSRAALSRVELEMKFGETAQLIRGLVLIAPRIGGTVRAFADPDVVRGGKEGLDRDAALRPSQRSPGTGVDPATERDVLPRISAVDLKLVGILEPPRVTVCRPRQQ